MPPNLKVHASKSESSDTSELQRSNVDNYNFQRPDTSTTSFRGLITTNTCFSVPRPLDTCSQYQGFGSELVFYGTRSGSSILNFKRLIHTFWPPEFGSVSGKPALLPEQLILFKIKLQKY